MHAAESPEEIKRHVEQLKELALRTPAGKNAAECKMGTKQKQIIYNLFFRMHNLKPHFSAKLVLI